MNIRTDNEWLRWGDVPTNFVGFFSPIESAQRAGEEILVKCKYGEYLVDPETQAVRTVSGVDWYILSEVAKYGMGYKNWETGEEDLIGELINEKCPKCNKRLYGNKVGTKWCARVGCDYRDPQDVR